MQNRFNFVFIVKSLFEKTNWSDLTRIFRGNKLQKYHGA